MQSPRKSRNHHEVIARVLGLNMPVKSSILAHQDLEVNAVRRQWRDSTSDIFVGNKLVEQARQQRKIRNTRKRADIQNNVGLVCDFGQNLARSKSKGGPCAEVIFTT